jgi:hypothetical protein
MLTCSFLLRGSISYCIPLMISQPLLLIPYPWIYIYTYIYIYIYIIYDMSACML